MTDTIRNVNAGSDTVPIDSIQPHPENPNEGDVGGIYTSIKENGWFGRILVQKSSDRIVAGEHRWKAAKEAGADHVDIEWLDVTDDEARRIMLVDNRMARLGRDNEHELSQLLTDLATETERGLAGTGFDGDDLDELLAQLDGLEPDPEPDPAAPPEEPATQPGDLWAVGPHLILCGDSSEIEVLNRLYGEADIGCVLTDPPYGIDLDTNYDRGQGNAGGRSGRGRTYAPVIGDDTPFDAGFHSQFFDGVAEQFWFGANYYRRTLPGTDLDGSWIVWDKRDEDPDDEMSKWDSAIGSVFELCWSRRAHRHIILRYRWTNWTSHENASHRREHPTEKPVAMLVDILDRWAPDGRAVADPFAGAGATLIAAHRTGRAGYGIELDPAYIDVIVQRLEKETGEKAVHVNTGEPFPSD